MGSENILKREFFCSQAVDPLVSAATEEENKSGSHKAYIALGSNMSDRQSLIELACREMDRRGVYVRRTSSLYETKPMYYQDQNLFLNGVCEVSRDLNFSNL